MTVEVKNDGTIAVLDNMNYFNEFELGGTKHLKIAGPPPEDESMETLPSSVDMDDTLKNLPQSSP